jgi:hypothetical protein
MTYKGNVIAVLGALALAGCGETSVAGSTYEAGGGAVQIAFQSGGKAHASIGPISSDCTYEQSGKTITLTCEGEKDVFTLDDDGSLRGPPNGMLARLTKKKA